VITLYHALRLAACEELKSTEASIGGIRNVIKSVRGEQEVVSKYVIVSYVGGSFRLVI